VTAIFQTGSTCSFYVNNTLYGTYAHSGSLPTCTQFCLGTYGNTTFINAFNGYIDDFKIYNYAMTMNPPINWRGQGTSVFSSQGNAVAWNGSMWIAVGSGTNSIAYSYDGITWTGLGTSFGTSIFTHGNAVAWNGFMWVAAGSGTHSIAYSYNGLLWITAPSNPFSTRGNGVAWNGTLWVAVGSGTNSIAYSYNGLNWTGLGVAAPIFTSAGNGVAWNGTQFVAVGSGGNTILYSPNGINWTAATVSCFTTAGYGVTWNGTRWVATGAGTNTIGFSTDGTSWYGSTAITPQLSLLAANTWVQNGITWNASASTIYSASYPAYGAFNNVYVNTGVYSWVSLATAYNTLSGAYIAPAPFNTTVLAGVGPVAGEWLQIQSSNPLTLYSYSYACGGFSNTPKTYFIVGSNNGTNWYPIQSCSMVTNPFLNTIQNFTTCSTYIIVNQSGTQTITGPTITGSGTFTTYQPYTTQAYTYFRIIGQTVWGSNGGCMEFGELFLNFGNGTIFTTQGSGIAWNGGLGSVNIQHPVIAAGQGTHTLAYSPDGVQWSGLGKSIFSIAGNGVVWNGSQWVAAGSGTNTLAYSKDGYRWTGIGTNTFSSQANGIAWNGSLWVAVGSGTNSVAYSADGIEWLPSVSGNAIFTMGANSVAWNGTVWVAVGQGTNSIAYSINGTVWAASSSTVFSTKGNGVAWTGSLWVAVGSGTNTIAYSLNGTSWTAVASSPFTTSGNAVTWNGTRWLAVGSGTNTIACSSNGMTWVGLGATLLSTSGNGVCWTGTRFVAVGQGANSIVYSQDGLTFSPVGIGSPLMYIPFENSTAEVLSNSTVTVIAGAAAYTTGIVGTSALNLVNTAGSAATNAIRYAVSLPTTNIAISGWFNAQSLPTVGAASVIVGLGRWTLDSYFHVRYVNAQTINGVSTTGLIMSFSNTGGTAEIIIGSVPSISLNTWYSFTCIYSQTGTCYAYLNNVMIGSVAGQAMYNNTTITNIAIGSNAQANASSFNGYVDDIRIYNTAISWNNTSLGIFTQGNGVAGNPRIGATICDSQLVLSGTANTLDIVSDTYCNNGYTEFAATIQTQALT
jgi:hypothetical protein